LVYPVTILAIGSLYYYFNGKLKNENLKIAAVGDIEFTRTSMVKRPGDSSSEFYYNSIKTIELQRHIPALNATESKSVFYT